MGKFDGFLLLADIDNTLVFHGEIPPYNLERIRYFTENGGLFSIATGRTPSGVTYLMEQVPINAPVVSCNGGTITDFQTGRTLYRQNLRQEDKILLCDLFDRYPDVGAEVQDGNDVYIVNDSKVVRDHVSYEHIPLRLAAARDLLGIEWHKILFSSDDERKIAEITAYTKTLPFCHAYVINTTNGINQFYIEVHPLESTKSIGATELKKIVGASKLFTIGDYYNDVDMLQVADVSAAVGGSPREVIEAATWEVCEAPKGAVGEFIDKIEAAYC